MATDQRNLPAYFSSDADFRTWGSGISAQLAAVGLVKTSDTSQINWASATRPGSAGQAGFEIWRFNDVLQATKPVFIRIGYGVSNPTDRPLLVIQAATGTDGNGTLTSQINQQYANSAALSKTPGATLPSYCSGGPSRLALANNVDAGSASFALLLLLERTKAVDGTDTDDGIVFFGSSATNTWQYQTMPFTGTIPGHQNVNMAASLTLSGISKVGTDVALSATIAPLGKPLFASWAAYLHADTPQLIPLSADYLGATRTMLPLGNTIQSGLAEFAGVAHRQTAHHSIAMLWE